MRKLWCVAVYLLLSSWCVTGVAQSLFHKDGVFSPYQATKFDPFQSVSPTHAIGGYPLIPLGNDFSLARLKVGSSAQGTPMGYAYLFDIRNGKFFASVDVEANLESGRGGDWTDEPCKRDSYLWKRSTGGDFKDVNCASINHLTNFWVNPKGDFQQLLVQVRQKKFQIPQTVVQVVFTRYSDRSRRVVYKVNLNPEFFGFETDPEPLWGANSWHRDFSSKDQKKSEFIARLAEWAMLVQDRMDAVFAQEKDAFGGIPAIEDFIRSR